MELLILSGTAHPELAQAIAAELKMPLTRTSIHRFADGEIDLQIAENIRRHHVVLIQTTAPPAENWMELFLLIDAARRASAAEISVVMPYMGYARQDRKDKPRKPISASCLPKLLIAAGANRLLTIDVHAAQTQGVIDEPFDNLFFSPLLLQSINERQWEKVVLVSPDAGGVARCRAIAQKLHCRVALLDKRREEANRSEVMHVVGEISGKATILLDDMIDTAGTIVEGAKALVQAGAVSVSACCTHPVLSQPAMQRLTDAPLDRLVVSDTIAIPQTKRDAIGKKLQVVSCAPLLAEAIHRIHVGESLSSLFDESLGTLL